GEAEGVDARHAGAEQALEGQLRRGLQIEGCRHAVELHARRAQVRLLAGVRRGGRDGGLEEAAHVAPAAQAGGAPRAPLDETRRVRMADEARAHAGGCASQSRWMRTSLSARRCRSGRAGSTLPARWISSKFISLRPRTRGVASPRSLTV